MDDSSWFMRFMFSFCACRAWFMRVDQEGRESEQYFVQVAPLMEETRLTSCF